LIWYIVAADTPCARAIESHVSLAKVVYVFPETNFGTEEGIVVLNALVVALKSATDMLQIWATYVLIDSQFSS
jgi:hypothetical protein